MIVAMLSWALYSALLKKKKFELSQLSLLQTIITAGLIFLLPIFILERIDGHDLPFGWPSLLILMYVVLFPGLISFIFWIKGISIIGTNRSGIFLHLMPIFSTTMAVIFLDERFMLFHLIGTISIIVGIALSTKNYHT